MSTLHTDAPGLMYRSLPILASYIILAAALALNACRVIYRRYQARQKANDWASPARRTHFFVFTALAALSLGATWYYMFAFFAHSYRNWEETRSTLDLQGAEVSILFKLEMWLQKTKLFREAWETVIETPARFWWSGQIFLWTTGWSVFLGIMGTPTDRSGIWIATNRLNQLGDIASRMCGPTCFWARLSPSPSHRTCFLRRFLSLSNQSLLERRRMMSMARSFRGRRPCTVKFCLLPAPS